MPGQQRQIEFLDEQAGVIGLEHTRPDVCQMQ
jgi:hypothetical protein